MADEVSGWKMENYNLYNIREEILRMADDSYREFQKKLLPGTENFIGVRLPHLRRLAKRIAKEDGEAYLKASLEKESKEELFEEIMLQGMVIGYMKGNISDIFSYTEKFVPKIDNWSVCDSFCSGFKHALEYPEMVWEWLKGFWSSEEEFKARFGIVMLLDYYINDKYIKELFPIFESIRQGNYYVDMAIAWAISICYIRYPKLCLGFLRESRLNDFTYHKSLQKIVESRCVSAEEKERLRKMRRK